MSLNSGLVGHWELSEESYNPATKRLTDKTPNENHGTSTNAGSFTIDRMGQANRAMTFNGTSDYIDCGNDSSLDCTDAITISAWIKPNDIVDYGTISEHLSNYIFRVVSSLLELKIKIGASWYDTKVSFTNTDSWSHVLWEYDISWGVKKAKIHIDGREISYVTQDTLPAGSLTIPTENMNIGSRGGTSNVFDGTIAETRIYNRALSAAEITQLYEQYRPKITMGSLQKGLVGHWSLDEESYNPATKRLTDKTPHSNHGTSANAGSFTADRMGQSNRAMTFNGESDYIDCGNDFAETAEDGFTMAAWINKLGGGSSQIIFGSVVQLRDAVCYIKDSGGTFQSLNYSDDLPSNGNWHHLAMTYETGGTLRIYINGVEGANSPLTGVSTPINNFTTIKIGGTSSQEFLNGQIADARIYNRALSADEITTLYEQYR